MPEPPAPLSLRGREPEVLADEVSLPRAYLAFCVPGYGSESWYAASLLATVLGEGKASPLFRELIYEQQIAHNVGCYVLPTQACATLCVVATGKPDATIEQLHDGVAQILNRVAEGSLLESDRQRALNTLLTVHQNDLQTLDSRADSISMGTTFFDRPGHAWSEPERYRAAGLKDLRDCVVQFCQPEMAANVSVVPSDR